MDGRTMVSDVKYTPSNSITLHDAMGRILVLPLVCLARRQPGACMSTEHKTFHATLINLFSRSNGDWFIDHNRYMIKHVHEGQEDYESLKSQDWEFIIYLSWCQG